jgi:hypothetical protein
MKKRTPKKPRKLSVQRELRALRKDHNALAGCVAVMVRNNELMIQQLGWLTHTLKAHLKGP